MKKLIRNINNSLWKHFLKFSEKIKKQQGGTDYLVSIGLELLEGEESVAFIGRRRMNSPSERFHFEDIILRSPIEYKKKEDTFVSRKRMEKLQTIFDELWEEFKLTKHYKIFKEKQSIQRKMRREKREERKMRRKK